MATHEKHDTCALERDTLYSVKCVYLCRLPELYVCLRTEGLSHVTFLMSDRKVGYYFLAHFSL